MGSNPFNLSASQESWVNATLESLSLEEKCGQIFCVLGDLYDDDALERMISQSGIGGILIRPQNASLIRKKFEGFDSIAKVPLLKAANMESGGDGAISDGTLFANPMQIAAAGDAKWAKKLGEVCAQEGLAAGINWTFSPVADIDFNFQNPITNTRTFGSNVEIVQKMTCEYMNAVQSLGIACAAKHFPGDGVDFRDHHLHPSMNSLSAEEWFNSYGKVYSALIGEGIKSIMVGHIMQPELAKSVNPNAGDGAFLPASLSPDLVSGIIRGKLGFEGLITTDATIMGGFCQAMKRSEAIPASIAAGVDMIVFNTNFDDDLQYLIDGVRGGIVSQNRLNDAVKSILSLKASVGLADSSAREIPEPAYSKQQILALRDQCAEESATLVKNLENAIPLNADSTPNIQLISLGNQQSCDGDLTELFTKELQSRGFAVEAFDIDSAKMDGPAAFKPNSASIYLANFEQKSDQTAIRIFWSEKLALNLPRFTEDHTYIFVSFANPYHLQDVPRIKTFVNAFTANQSTISAAAKAICGEIPFKGTSPSDPFCALLDTKI